MQISRPCTPLHDNVASMIIQAFKIYVSWVSNEAAPGKNRVKLSTIEATEVINGILTMREIGRQIHLLTLSRKPFVDLLQLLRALLEARVVRVARAEIVRLHRRCRIVISLQKVRVRLAQERQVILQMRALPCRLFFADKRIEGSEILVTRNDGYEKYNRRENDTPNKSQQRVVVPENTSNGGQSDYIRLDTMRRGIR